MRCSIQATSGHQAPLRHEILPDFYIALACGRGDAVAIQRFGEHFAGVVDGVRRRFGARAPTREETLADLHERLFAPREGAPPRILEYGGEAELRTWLKVVTTRLLLNRLAARKPEDAFEDSVLENLGVTWEGPERLLQREEARAQFRASFRKAVRALAARDRQILRLAFAEGLTIDDLGELFGVHRTTAFRRLQQASDRLAAALRKIVREDLGMSEQQYERWCESLRSGLEISIQRYFEETGAAPGSKSA